MTLLAAITYGAFIWAALFFFRTGNAGSLKGKRVVSALGLLAVVLCLWSIWQAPWHGSSAQLAACAMLAAASGLFWWSISTLRRRPLDFALSDQLPQQLVKSGPYRYWRHPLYVSYTLGWLAAAPASGQAWALAVPLIMGGVYAVAMTREEAQFAQSVFASDYAEYRQRAKLLIPGLW